MGFTRIAKVMAPAFKILFTTLILTRNQYNSSQAAKGKYFDYSIQHCYLYLDSQDTSPLLL